MSDQHQRPRMQQEVIQPGNPKPDGPIEPLKSAAQMVTEIVGAINKVAPTYKMVGPAGILVISGVFLAFLSLILSFLSGINTDDGTRTFGLIFEEEIAFLIAATGFATLGTGLFIVSNAQNKSLSDKSVQFDIKRMEFLHEENLRKIEHNKPAELPQSPTEGKTQNAAATQKDSGIAGAINPPDP